jgi:hypothetical protein
MDEKSKSMPRGYWPEGKQTLISGPETLASPRWRIKPPQLRFMSLQFFDSISAS